jgi:hypothetical protein
VTAVNKERMEGELVADKTAGATTSKGNDVFALRVVSHGDDVKGGKRGG